MSMERPSWMDGDTPKARQPRSQGVPVTPPAYRESPAPARTTHRNVVVGVTILAVLTLFNVWFWTGIVVIGTINPPERAFDLGSLEESVITPGDYLSVGRVLIGFIAGIVGTVASWVITDSVIGD